MTKPQLGRLTVESTVIGKRDRLTYRGNVKHGRHSWLRLTPAYGLHVVEEILATAAKDEIVLDPFSGTGTTPLVAAQMRHPAHAVDINPFLVWLGNLKVSNPSAATIQELREVSRQIVAELRHMSSQPKVWYPDIHQIDKWWDSEVLYGLGSLYNRVERADKQVVDFLKVAFCRTAIEVAHVSFGHQSMSFKKRKNGDQLLLDVESGLETVWRKFLMIVEDVAESLGDRQPEAKAQVFLGDSRDLTNVLPRSDYGLVVTSPPYPNRMSYIRELRPYMYWLGYLTNGREAGELDWKAIGGTWGCATSNLGTWEPQPKNEIPFAGFRKLVDEISAEHPLLGRYVHKYFEDVCGHLASLKQVLKVGARCYYVVGNSKFYNTLLPVERIYAALFTDLGFANVHIETIRKRTSKKELFEYVVYAERV